MSAPQISSLPSPKRYVTDHDSEGKAIFHKTLTTEPTWMTVKEDLMQFNLLYTTSDFPIDLSTDVTKLAPPDDKPTTLTMPNGSVLRMVDFAPNTWSPMH